MCTEHTRRPDTSRAVPTHPGWAVGGSRLGPGRGRRRFDVRPALQLRADGSLTGSGAHCSSSGGGRRCRSSASSSCRHAVCTPETRSSTAAATMRPPASCGASERTARRCPSLWDGTRSFPRAEQKQADLGDGSESEARSRLVLRYSQAWHHDETRAAHVRCAKHGKLDVP